MEIALYSSHHSLPFWHAPKQPDEMFVRAAHCDRVLSTGPAPELVLDNWIWHMLLGLELLEAPTMAHVSAFCNCGRDAGWHFPKRVWVQITTIPTEKTADGLPVVVRDDGRVAVEHLWGGDNGTHTPLQLLPEKVVEGGDITWQYWRCFFDCRLHDAKAAATTNVTKLGDAHLAAQEVAHLYDFMN